MKTVDGIVILENGEFPPVKDYHITIHGDLFEEHLRFIDGQVFQSITDCLKYLMGEGFEAMEAREIIRNLPHYYRRKD